MLKGEILSDEALFLSLQAASKLLSVYPHVLDTFLSSIQSTHSIFDLAVRAPQNPLCVQGNLFSRTEVLKLANSLLKQSAGRVLEIWEWSPIVSLFTNSSQDVKVQAVRVVGAVLSLSEWQISSMVRQVTGGNGCLTEVSDCRLLHGENEEKLECVRLFLCGIHSISPGNGQDISFHKLAIGQCEDFKKMSDNFGALFSDMAPGYHASLFNNDFVHTATTCRNLSSMAIALCQHRPLLVEGPTGSGKTALVEYAAWLTGNSNTMIRVHLDDQMDSKTLIGSYVCTETPGEFVWKAGALTQAVEQVCRSGAHAISLNPVCHPCARALSPSH